MKISVLILTYNEEIHIKRCIESAKKITKSIYVIDSYSSDKTAEIALSLGAKVLKRRFDSHSVQFNWGLQQIEKCDWVVRLDADEFFDSILSNNILSAISEDNDNFNGYAFKRNIKFLGKKIKYGGLFPIEIVRMFRYGYGKVEPRLMDEHIIINGKCKILDGELIDDNKNSLSWWIAKHNKYSSLEALELLSNYNKNNKPKLSGNTAKRRKLKTFYSKMPLQLRAISYFTYRYFLRFGFMDGFNGFLFHFYQGLWYRLLVDSKFQLLIKSKDNSLETYSKILDLELEIIESKFSNYDNSI
jgi:glycosyltransferase involved in cell wall biosynthesis